MKSMLQKLIPKIRTDSSPVATVNRVLVVNCVIWGADLVEHIIHHDDKVWTLILTVALGFYAIGAYVTYHWKREPPM